MKTKSKQAKKGDQSKRIENYVDSLSVMENNYNQIELNMQKKDIQIKGLQKQPPTKPNKYTTIALSILMAYGLITFITFEPNMFNWNNSQRTMELIIATFIYWLKK